MVKTLNPDFKSDIEEKLKRQHFMKLMNFKLTKIEEGLIEGELDVEQIHKQQKGFVHGGVIATMADIVSGFAAVSLVPKGHHVVTAEIKVSYLNPGLGDKLLAKGWVIRQGRNLNFCEAEIYSKKDGKSTLISKATTTMATITPEDVERKKLV